MILTSNHSQIAGFVRYVAKYVFWFSILFSPHCLPSRLIQYTRDLTTEDHGANCISCSISKIDLSYTIHKPCRDTQKAKDDVDMNELKRACNNNIVRIFHACLALINYVNIHDAIHACMAVEITQKIQDDEIIIKNI